MARAPGLDGLGDGEHHPAVLERAGRVPALDLEVQVAQAERRAEAFGPDQRREALAQGQRRRRLADRQEPAVAVDRGAGGRARAGCPAQSSIGYRMPLAVSRVSASGRDDRVAGRRRAPRVADPMSSPPRGRPRSGRPGPPTRSRRRRRPGRRSRPARRAIASISIRLRTPAVRPSAESSGSAVGRTAARSRPVAVGQRRSPAAG